MEQLDPLARPAVDQETLSFLRHLTDTKIFRMQYEAWAYGAALALREGLHPANVGTGKEQLPPLSTLPEETRFALEQAALLSIQEQRVEDFVAYINSLAIAGLRVLKQRIENLSLQEKINIVLSELEPRKDNKTLK